ncbi:hypothetical protein [Persephonella sp.]
MKKYLFSVILLISLVFTTSKAEYIAVKRPEIKNLPRGYAPVFFSFFETHFENVVRFPSDRKISYIIQPTITWVATSYNICLNIYKGAKLIDVFCTVSFSGEELHDDLERLSLKTGILKRKDDKKTEYFYIKLIGRGEIRSDKIKIVSSKGDVLVNYKEIINNTTVSNIITIPHTLINLDTAYIQNFEASKLLEHLLNNKKIKGILIIKTY